MTTQITPDVETLRREIQKKYTEVATSPDLTFHFHHGRPLAQLLGYPMDRVDAMPPEAVAAYLRYIGFRNAKVLVEPLGGLYVTSADNKELLLGLSDPR